jgi:HTH-type transcriptional regulator/antitoxin HipB
MPGFTVRTAEQLPTLLKAFRKEARLTQSEVARRLGVTQQTYSAMERNADLVGAARLLKLLQILGVEMVLDKVEAGERKGPGTGSPDVSRPAW